MPADVLDTAVGFARTLRASGVGASTDRVQRFVESLDALDPRRREDVYWAGRVTFCASPDDLARYDRAFAAYFDREPLPRPPRQAATPPPVSTVASAAPGADDGGDDDVDAVAEASRAEVLRHQDLGRLDAAGRAEVARLVALLDMPAEHRRTRRREPARRGRVDQAATVRQLLRHGGEPVVLRYHRQRRRPRRVVILADVSGSMSSYSESLVRFAHAAARRRAARVEVFTIGTRLTRVTRELTRRDPNEALAATGAAVPDWSGGTRLGERLKEFLDVWGQRGMARGAVVVILSDGWERDDPALLGQQMARLGRLAHKVVWANPRKARPGYAPLAGGMAAALPHVDDFVEGHSLAALERLARVVAGIQRTHQRRR